MKDRDKPFATLVVIDAGGHAASSFARRKAVALWLRRQARALVMKGHNYAGRFTARLHP